MKHAGLIFFSMGLQIFAFSQAPDSIFTKQEIKSTEYTYLFSYYQQDGNHSAVTGGSGTEKLQVFLNKLNVTHVIDTFNTIFFEGGIDVISSASTDNIDVVVSSASAIDQRLWVAAGYQRQTKNKRHLLGAKPSFSMESDYLSLGMETWWTARNQLNNWRYGLNIDFFSDDLRWGRLNEDFRKPVTVVYPFELRDSVWFDIYRRYSYNFSFDIQHDINRRTSIGFFPGISFQHGLLSTPFHRFYYSGISTAVVENLPRQRIKFPLGIQLNTFIGARTVIQLYYRYYWDDFGIYAHTFNIETPIKLVPQFALIPFFRFYTQGQADYFYPIKEAPAPLDFFTSDYDLSGFSSFKLGLGMKINFIKRSFFKQISLRYAHYSRSDGLYFNQVSSYYNMSAK